MSEELDQTKEAMARAVKALDQDFSKLNTGRPSASILDNVKVDYYGVATPVSQVGAIKKDGEISEDEQHREEEQLQKITDDFIAKIDAALSVKEAEVMEI